MISHTAALVRRAFGALVALALIGVGSVLLAAPAGADVPVGWSDPDPVDPLHTVLVLVGIPLILLVVITVLVYAPALVRGERLAPGAPAVENQWLGGPRRTTAELAAPDTDDSQAGGASARW
ncbi:MAG: hypothetical protein F2667_01855 [Actinobacteria bacterium]|uniref:Unannotated protein n=1 Tax=freshwater metagenome TaxID=449393 RepID=A0A6J6P0A7_9ZZZZ|nr:hypothetical protein [Actinomycetota bacterium]